jgi:glucose-1-phosphate thymidylyltransferase
MVYEQFRMGYFMRKLGIILAGGKSTRLFPSTLVTTKQLLPVFDKPMIYYPLSTLMLAGIKDFVIISSPAEVEKFKELFKDCKSEMGINVTVLEQPVPVGIADAFRIIVRELGHEFTQQFIRHALILGDNIFYGAGFSSHLINANKASVYATIFLHTVPNPSQFGIATTDSHGTVLNIEEKPENPESNLAITGLYFYPSDVYDFVMNLTPSSRGELEITDLNKFYLNDNRLVSHRLQRGMMWFDAGNSESLLEASNFIKFIQTYQGILVGSPHEIAIHRKLVSRTDITPFLEKCSKTDYGKYLQTLMDNDSKSY